MRRPYALVAVIAVLVLGIYLGGHPATLPGFARDALVGDGDTRVVRQAIETVHDRYYRKVSERRLADAAVRGMVASLDDPFSQFFDRTENQRFEESTDNAYVGIGIEVRRDARGLAVTRVYAGSPAARAGLRRGDVIVAVGAVSLAGKGVDAASQAVRGPEGSTAVLRVRRAGRQRTYRVAREQLHVPIVSTSLRTVHGRRIGVIALANFERGATSDVREALGTLQRRGAKAFVLDLRRNPGGLLDQAQGVAGLFLRGGTVVTIKGRSVPTETLKATGRPALPDAPLVVLVDHDSASASEAVAGALQDRGRATLVGTHTYGKGVFQQVYDLAGGTALKITQGQYFTPKGRNLGGAGVHTGAGLAPDVKAQDDPKTRADEALDVALKTAAEKPSR